LTPSEHGGTESDHVKALREMGADIPDDSVEMPSTVSYLWGIHRDIRFTKPLTLGCVIQYSEYMGLDLNRTEIGAIMAMDSIYDRYAS
tara:strand:- start:1179 stop:1442 length:264 start_codon:yes stop_codon:yes gene_type:complete